MSRYHDYVDEELGGAFANVESIRQKLREVNRAYLEKSSKYDSFYEAYQKTAEVIMVNRQALEAFTATLGKDLEFNSLKKTLWIDEKTFPALKTRENGIAIWREKFSR